MLKDKLKNTMRMNGVRSAAYDTDTLVISIEDTEKLIDRVFEDEPKLTCAGKQFTINELSALKQDLSLAVEELSGLLTGECSFSKLTSIILTEMLEVHKEKLKRVQDTMQNMTVTVNI